MISRTLALWVPQWPVVAAVRGGGEGAPASTDPIAVLASGVVVACSDAASADGVRVGQRRRDAQSRCPQLLVVAADPVREHRTFGVVLEALEALSPGVQPIRPGLCALRVRGPARFYGGEAGAATVLAGAVLSAGIEDVRVGVADGPFTAEHAARAGTSASNPVRIVPEGQAATFLAPLPVSAVDQEAAHLFARLGVHTLGQLVALGPQRLSERFGARGARLHALASGADSRPVTPRIPPPERHREVWFEPPVALAEQVAFGIRVPAEEFVATLGADGLVCTEVRVILVAEDGPPSERVWLHPGVFDTAAIVDRVRWQLSEQGLRGAVVRVRLEPVGVEDAAHHTARLFGSGPEERVHHAFSRVQAMLGHHGVVTPAIGGGRWLAERQVLTAWGDRVAAPQERARPWPGSLPEPLPATVFSPTLSAAVIDAEGDMVAVDRRGEPTARPEVLEIGGRRRGIQHWAGPWPVIERTWDAVRTRRAHRFQIVDAEESAWLLVCEEGAWQVEGRYD